MDSYSEACKYSMLTMLEITHIMMDKRIRLVICQTLKSIELHISELWGKL